MTFRGTAQEIGALRVGDNLYNFDGNRRVYAVLWRKRHKLRNCCSATCVTALDSSLGCVSFPAGNWGDQRMPKRDKTVSYRRAEWVSGVMGLTLQKCLADALANLKTIDERTIVRGGTHTRSLKHKVGTGGIYLHITADTPGEAASVVPKATPGTAELDLKIEQAPPDGEWLDGDAFLYVSGDHVCMCSTAIRDSTIQNYLFELFKKAQLRRDSIRFQLMKAADITKLKMLHNQGVKELEIRGTLYKVTADFENRRGRVSGGLGAVGKHIAGFFKKPNDVTPDGLRVMVTLKVDRRFGKEISLGEKRIEAMAADVVKNSSEVEDFVIITKTGQKINPREIFMRSKVSIDSDGKTVDRDKAWRELLAFFNQLVNTGVLEQ